MPINLNKIMEDADKMAADATVAFAKQNVYAPKFFSSHITGNGQTTRGLLRPNTQPAALPNGYKGTTYNMKTKTTVTNGNITIYNIPISCLYRETYDMIFKLPMPDKSECKLIATHPSGINIYLWCPIHNIQINEQDNPTTKSTVRDLSVIFHTMVFAEADTNEPIFDKTDYWSPFAPSQLVSTSGKKNIFYQDYTPNLLAAMKNIQSQLKSLGYDIDTKALNDYFQKYNLYDDICRAARRWQENIDTLIADVLLKNAEEYEQRTGDTKVWDRTVIPNIAYLETYAVSLNMYKSMYDKMNTYLGSVNKHHIMNKLCKHNLNLLLSDMLNQLDINRANHYRCITPANNAPVSTGAVPFSPDQMAAITTAAPFVLVQSGAGTGKSTVINGRMAYMEACGINMDDITVLSFTNAAANHITELQPRVHSMTIDRMMHTIYSNNFKHELSQAETIFNTLDIYYNDVHDPDYTTAMKFKEVIHAFCERRMPPNAFTQLNNFIEENLDAVLRILDTINQTCLEIESIICYQLIDTLVEPQGIQTKYLIIDEVQDNSVFNFIYTIKYTLKHQCSMFIVGDCSQTLYEFRASNPKALNVLEASGIFETYKLQINYRSSQEILDFANVLLGNIEANQFANIQLQSNILKPVTLQSFQDAVNFKYDRLNKLSDFHDALPHILAVEIRNYIDTKYQAGEQVCFLSYSGNIAEKMQETIQHLYPAAKCINLRSERSFNSTIFTQFIARYWDQIQFLPPTHIMATIKTELNNRLQYLPQVSAKKLQVISASVNRNLWDFEKQYGIVIQNWETQVVQGTMTQAQMLDEIKKLMIQFEISKNAIKQAVVANRNAEAKKSQDINSANFLFSTIHGVKGLEFDNVVVIYQNKNDMPEDQKRLYYVAFTRAKKSEYIVSYDTLAKPKIESDYNHIISELTKKQNAQMQVVQMDDGTVIVDEAVAPTNVDVSDTNNGVGGESADNTMVSPPIAATAAVTDITTGVDTDTNNEIGGESNNDSANTPPNPPTDTDLPTVVNG